MKHFLKFSDFSKDEFDHIIERTTILKKRFKQYIPYQPLTDRMLAMVFEKSSTRTRVSFEAGIYQLGGQAINLDSQSTQLGRAEPIEDTARVHELYLAGGGAYFWLYAKCCNAVWLRDGRVSRGGL